MRVATRLGPVDVSSKDILYIPGGILGFPEYRRYFIMNHRTDTPLKWLQSLEKEDLAFPVAASADLVPAYAMTVSPDDLAAVGCEAGDELLTYLILTIPGGAPERMTANLRAPLVVNTETRIARQILTLEDHPIRYPLSEPRPMECSR